MTFGELTKNCTDAEKDALAWHLASLRARATYAALKPCTHSHVRCAGGVWRCIKCDREQPPSSPALLPENTEM